MVLVSGLLVLLAFLGLTFVQAGRLGGIRSEVLQASVQAGLAAESGMSYAAARLVSSAPTGNTTSAISRGDDWSFRDESSISARMSESPSYSHGEPWDDRNGNGIRDHDERFEDVDGNGCFSPRSGRLRGEAGSARDRFTLKIVADGGRIPLNAGFLDALDRNENGVPDHRDISLEYQASLVYVLNNFGAVVRPASGGAWTRREDRLAGDPSSPGTVLHLSWLGMDLLRNRPVGGYRSLDDVRRVLITAGYREDEWERIMPFVTVQAPPPFGAYRRDDCRDGGRVGDPPPRYIPVHLSVAPFEVLQSLFMYLTYQGASAADWIPGEADGWSIPCSRTGGGGTRLPYADMRLVIFSDEAERLAREIAASRSGGLSWKKLYGRFLSAAPEIFSRDFADLAGYPVLQNGWVEAKAEIAFHAVSLDSPIRESMRSTWGGWGLERRAGSGQYGLVSFDGDLRGLPYPKAPGDGWRNPFEPFGGTAGGDNDQDSDSTGSHGNEGSDGGGEGGGGDENGSDDEGESLSARIAPQGGTLVPPSIFEVESCGLSGGTGIGMARGILDSGVERLEFTCQEDFENLTGGVELAARGIAVRDDPEPEFRRPAMADGARTYPHAIVLPNWNIRSVSTPAEAAATSPLGSSRGFGGIGLAPRETGLQGAEAYLTFPEDFAPGRQSRTEGTAGEVHRKVSRGVLQDMDWVLWDRPTAPSPTAWCEWRESHQALTAMTRVSCECWMGVPGSLAVVGSWRFPFPMDEKQGALWICLEKSADSPSKMVCRVHVDGWLDARNSRTIMPARTAWDLDEERMSALGASRGAHHVAVTLDATVVPGSTRVSVFIDGRNDWPGQPMEIVVPGIMAKAGGSLRGVRDGNTKHSCQAVDEIRFHAGILGTADIAARRDAGLFVKSGCYLSPRYDFDEPALFHQAQWTGHHPLGFPPGALKVQMAWTDARGDRHVHLLGPSGPAEDLSTLKDVRSFQYQVLLDCTDHPGPVWDSPVFESIWFTFRRAGRSGIWTGWGAQ